MDTPHQSIKLIFSHLPEATRKAFDVSSQQRWLREQGWLELGVSLESFDLSQLDAIALHC